MLYDSKSILDSSCLLSTHYWWRGRVTSMPLETWFTPMISSFTMTKT